MKQARVTKNGQKSPSRNIARTKDARDKLLKVGLAVFLKEGSGNLSVRSVAAKAGVNLGSFVYHFKTKDAFIEECLNAAP